MHNENHFENKCCILVVKFSCPANAPLDTTTTELLSFDPGVIAGEYTIMHVYLYTLVPANVNFYLHTGIAVTAGVLLLLVAVTGVVILLLVIFGRKHANKQGNL